MGLGIETFTLLASISASSTDSKRTRNSNPTQFIQGLRSQIKPLQLVGRAAESKFESKFEPCLSSGITPDGYCCYSRKQSKVGKCFLSKNVFNSYAVWKLF